MYATNYVSVAGVSTNPPLRRLQAACVLEVVVVLALFGLLLTALISTQLLGLKMHRHSANSFAASGTSSPRTNPQPAGGPDPDGPCENGA